MKDEIVNSQRDVLIPEHSVRSRLPFKPLTLWSRSDAHRMAVIVWLLLCLLAVPSGMLTRIFEWSGISVWLWGTRIHITVYIPMLFCVPIALWYGYWWAAIPAYLSTVCVALLGGMPPGWTLLFALSNPLGLAVLIGLYSTSNMTSNLRTPRQILTFSAFSLLATLTGSAGAFVWAHTNNVGIHDVFPVWQGWWLGGWLQNLLLVAPLLAILGGRVERALATLRDEKPDAQKSLRNTLPMVLLSVAILLAYVFAARYLAHTRIERFTAAEMEPAASQAMLEMVSTLSYPIFLMTGVIVGLVYFGYRSLYRWTNRLRSLNHELRTQNEQLEQLATVDSLSGVFNRRKTFALIETEFVRSKRTAQDMIIVMIDADHFKHINDNFGHNVGDQVIRQLAIRLEGALRQYDVLGRYGGEEFIAMLPQTSDEQGRIISDRMREVVEQRPLNTSARDIELTVSVGYAVLHANDENFKEIIERADNALFRAKANGRNCVETSAYDENNSSSS